MKKEERKEQIKKAAIKLMCKQGYTKTSVQNILDEINYSKSGFYNCYESKEEMLREIMQDGLEHRNKQVLTYKKNSKLSRKETLVEALLDKILDYNDYKKLTSNIIMEMNHREDFVELQKKMMDNGTESFKKFCKEEGFEEYIKVSNYEFGVLITSLIIGNDIFKLHDDKKYRKLLRDIITAYFEKINLFD